MASWAVKHLEVYGKFMASVKEADHGFLRGFAPEKSSLRPLLNLIENTEAGQLTAGQVDAEIEKIPREKRTKYARALDVLLDGFAPAKAPLRIVRINDNLELLRSPYPGTSDCLIWGHAGYIANVARLSGTFRICAPYRLHFYEIHTQTHRTRPEMLFEARPKDDEIVFRSPTASWAGTGEERKLIHHKLNLATQDRCFSKANKVLRGNDKLRDNTANPEGKVFTTNDECYNYVIKHGLGTSWKTENPETGQHWTTDDLLLRQDRQVADARRRAVGPKFALPRNLWAPHIVHVPSSGHILLDDLLRLVGRFFASHRDTLEPIRDFYFAGCRELFLEWEG